MTETATAATHQCGTACGHPSDCGLHNAPACYEPGAGLPDTCTCGRDLPTIGPGRGLDSAERMWRRRHPAVVRSPLYDEGFADATALHASVATDLARQRAGVSAPPSVDDAELRAHIADAERMLTTAGRVAPMTVRALLTALREARAESERLRGDRRQEVEEATQAWRDAEARAERAEAERDRLRAQVEAVRALADECFEADALNRNVGPYSVDPRAIRAALDAHTARQDADTPP